LLNFSAQISKASASSTFAARKVNGTVWKAGFASVEDLVEAVFAAYGKHPNRKVDGYPGWVSFLKIQVRGHSHVLINKLQQ